MNEQILAIGLHQQLRTLRPTLETNNSQMTKVCSITLSKASLASSSINWHFVCKLLVSSVGLSVLSCCCRPLARICSFSWKAGILARPRQILQQIFAGDREVLAKSYSCTPATLACTAAPPAFISCHFWPFYILVSVSVSTFALLEFFRLCMTSLHFSWSGFFYYS